MRQRRRSLIAFGLLALPADAWAEEPYALDQVVVTATRQNEALRDLAGNTEILDAGTIDAVRPQRPSEILNRVPGVNIQQGSGEEHLTAIRSPVLNGGAGAGSFLFLEDGVPLRAAGFGNVNGLYEANAEQSGRIEVVRGPGSALYGSNALHGLINFIPRDPPKNFEAVVDGTYGQYGTERLTGTVGDTVGRHGMRLGVVEAHEDGWRSATALDEQKVVARSVWRGDEDTVTSTLSGQMLDQGVGAYMVGPRAYQDRAAAKGNPNPAAYREAQSARGMSRWQHDLDSDTQLSLTPYVRYTAMDFMMHYTPQTPIQKNAHGSVGTQAALYRTVGARSSVILGLDSEYTDGWYYETQNKPTLVQGRSVYTQGVHYDFATTATVFAPYAHAEWQVLDSTRLVTGLRTEYTRYEYQNNLATGTVGLYFRQGSRGDDFLTLTPKVGLVQDWAPWVSSYATVTRGARAPQVTDLYALQYRQVPGQVKAETLDSMEVGTRARFDGVSVDLAAYWMHKKNVFYRSSNGLNVSDGATDHRGLELGVSAPLPAGFDIGVSASLALHTYAYAYTDTSAGATGVIASVHKNGLMPEAPRHQGTLRLGYTPWEGTRAELEWMHVGAYTTDNAGTHSYGGHELFNLRLAADLSSALSVNAKAMNLFDRAYADRATVSVVGVDQYFPGAPRTVMVGMTARF